MLHLLDAVRRDIALQKKYPCLAMPDDTSTNLEHQVDRHERELELDGKDLEKLKKEIAALKHDVEGLIKIIGITVPFPGTIDLVNVRARAMI